MKKIKLFEDYQKEMRNEEETKKLVEGFEDFMYEDHMCIPETTEEECEVPMENEEEVSEEEEYIKKGTPCVCSGDGCDKCNGIGFIPNDGTDDLD